jgi:hypothetical protein
MVSLLLREKIVKKKKDRRYVVKKITVACSHVCSFMCAFEAAQEIDRLLFSLSLPGFGKGAENMYFNN